MFWFPDWEKLLLKELKEYKVNPKGSNWSRISSRLWNAWAGDPQYRPGKLLSGPSGWRRSHFPSHTRGGAWLMARWKCFGFNVFSELVISQVSFKCSSMSRIRHYWRNSQASHASSFSLSFELNHLFWIKYGRFFWKLICFIPQNIWRYNHIKTVWSQNLGSHIHDKCSQGQGQTEGEPRSQTIQWTVSFMNEILSSEEFQNKRWAEAEYWHEAPALAASYHELVPSESRQ